MEKFEIKEDKSGFCVIDNQTRTAHIGFASLEEAQKFINNKSKNYERHIHNKKQV